MDQSKLFYVLAYPGVLKIASDWSCSGDVEVTVCMLMTHQLFESELILKVNQACALFHFSCMLKCPPELDLVVGSDVFLVSLSLRQQARFSVREMPLTCCLGHMMQRQAVF